MNVTNERRKSIAASEKIVNAIGNKLNDNDKNSKVNLSKIAKDLASRRDEAIKGEEK